MTITKGSKVVVNFDRLGLRHSNEAAGMTTHALATEIIQAGGQAHNIGWMLKDMGGGSVAWDPVKECFVAWPDKNSGYEAAKGDEPLVAIRRAWYVHDKMRKARK